MSALTSVAEEHVCVCNLLSCLYVSVWTCWNLHHWPTYQSCKTEHKQTIFFHIPNLMVILTHELAITVLPEDTYLRCNPVKLVKCKFAYAFMCLNKIFCFLFFLHLKQFLFLCPCVGFCYFGNTLLLSSSFICEFLSSFQGI